MDLHLEKAVQALLLLSQASFKFISKDYVKEYEAAINSESRLEENATERTARE